jgi:transcriptional regulator with XRE-family HTH domain
MRARPPGNLGRLIREQRQLAHLSVRELARLASISNAYLSQVERGLHEPSVRVLQAVADVLEVPVEDLVGPSGRRDVKTSNAAEAGVEGAVRSDPVLSVAQKDALLAVYRTFIADADSTVSGPTGRRRSAAAKRQASPDEGEGTDG